MIRLSPRVLRPPWLEALLAGGFAWASLAEIWGHGQPAALAIVAALACTLAVALVRVSPVGAALTVGLTLAVAALAGEPPESIGVLMAVVAVVYAVSARVASLRMVLPAILVVSVGISISVLRDPTDDGANIPPTLVLFVAAPLLGGRMFASRVRAQRAERERAERDAIAAERARIARELHDIIGHSVSVIAVQADAGAAALDHDPERAREPLRAIGATARDALGELRRVLDVLRDGDGSEQLEPQPGLVRLQELVDQVRRPGLEVAFSVEGDPVPIPRGVDLTAYRVVQESLTNAIKHAGTADVRVTLRYLVREIELEIADDGKGATAASGNGGHGLVGMRERVDLYGGTFTAGPVSAGGYRVLARLPLP